VLSGRHQDRAREKKATDGLTEVGATLLGIEVAELLLAAGAAEIADLAAS